MVQAHQRGQLEAAHCLQDIAIVSDRLAVHHAALRKDAAPLDRQPVGVVTHLP